MAGRFDSFLKDRLLRNPAFLFCLGLYAVFRLALWLVPEQVPLLLQHYLADFLSLPVILTLAVLIQRQLLQRNPHYTLTKWQVLFAFAYISVLFELVFPMFLPRYTSDWRDVIAYAAGALLYWQCINPAPKAR